jgi:hypothetical protein
VIALDLHHMAAVIERAGGIQHALQHRGRAFGAHLRAADGQRE